LPERFVRIGGFAIGDCDFAGASQHILGSIDGGSKIAVFFANTHFVVTCQPLRERLSQAASFLILNDGIGLSLARRLLFRSDFAENLNGTDFIPRLLLESVRPLRLYLLGSAEASVEGAALAFAKMGQVEIAGTCDGYSLWSREEDVIARINASRPDILLVALGCPKQEQWILDHFDRLQVPAVFAIGALFDFVSGQQARAPDFMRKTGLEWLYRLWREPRRLLYRYTIEILLFLRIVFSNASAPAHPAVADSRD
jgi:beta-1,4-glucosyltransferase